MAIDGWTIGELAARVAAALGDGYSGAPNGRVRDLPDARAIRWYATIGLVDRPSAMRGRTALYGPRHLLQLVAVKRRQAQGRTIAQIQQELAGATETTLHAIAEVPPTLLSPGGTVEMDDGGAGPAVAVPPGPVPVPPSGPAPAPAAGGDRGESPGRTARFWAARPVAPHAEPDPAQAAPRPAPRAAPRPTPPAGPPAAPAGAPRPAPAGDLAGPALLTGIPLTGGAVLLLPATPDPDDLTAIAVAARPLLDLLSARGLLRSEP